MHILLLIGRLSIGKIFYFFKIYQVISLNKIRDMVETNLMDLRPESAT